MSQPPGWGNPPEPPDPWQRPADSWQQPPDPSQRLPDASQPVQWGNYTPPPGWTPPPQNKIKGREIGAGLGAWFLVNGLLLGLGKAGLGNVGGGVLSLLVVGANLAMIVVPAVKGHKGFAVGFALGYVVAFFLAIGACFVALANLNKSSG